MDVTDFDRRRKLGKIEFILPHNEDTPLRADPVLVTQSQVVHLGSIGCINPNAHLLFLTSEDTQVDGGGVDSHPVDQKGTV